METERWKKTETLFRNALELPPEDRSAFLDRSCGADPALRHEVESLLAADGQASEFLETPAVQLDLDEFKPQLEDWTGRILGPWLLVRRVGHGGMGVVYEGKRADGQFEKRVAVKVVKRGMDTDEILHRFQVEKQALASVQHANIAGIYDAGSTEDGRPYLVMEFHEGDPITAHCEEKKLGIPERIRIFQQVCAAVQCAHQNLVIHRDIKPSNIVVDAQGIPKLLDFGIAKIVQPDSRATATANQDRFLSPGYASPEQIQGLPVTTATDIYSLGVVLDEMLPGERVGENKAGPSMHRTPELNHIVLMAQRTEPERRYASARDLVEDLERHLDGRPVLAQPDTFGYRLKKFVQRNKWQVAAALLVMLATIGGLSATLWQAQEKAAALTREASRAQELQQFAGTLIRETLEKIRNVPGTTQAQADLVRRSLAALDGLFREHGQDPSLRRDLALAYGKVAQVQWSPSQSSLGDSRGAAETYRREILLWEELLQQGSATPEDRNALAQAYANLGELHLARAEHEIAIGHFSRSLDLAQGFNAAWTRRRLAEALSAAGRTQESEAQIEQAAADYEKQREANPRDAELMISVADLWKRAGELRRERGETDAANEAFRKALDFLQANGGQFDARQRGSYWLSVSMTQAGIYRQLDQDERAAILYAKSVARAQAEGLAESSSAATRRRVAQLHEAHADFLQSNRQISEAVESLEKARRIYEGVVQIDPIDLTARRDALAVLQRIGLLHAVRNNGALTHEALREFFQGMKALIEADSGSLELRRTLAGARMRYGDILSGWAMQDHRPERNRKEFWRGAKLQYEGAAVDYRGLVGMGDAEASSGLERAMALAARAKIEEERL